MLCGYTLTIVSLGKHVPVEANTHAAVEELPFLYNGEVNIPL
jgi:hypothetical protein